MFFAGLYGLIFIACLISQNGKRRIPRIVVCALIFLGMQSLLGLRHIQYAGVDTQVYARDFMRIVNQHYSFADIFTYFSKDFGFYLFAKLFSFFCNDMNAWIFVCAIPYTYAVTWLIYKYSQNIFLSFIMFLSFGHYLYNFQLMRHVFALGMIVLAFKYLQEEQYKKFFISVAIATFFHTIAIVFMASFFIKKGTISFKQFLWIVLGGVSILVLSQQSVLMAVFNVIPLLRSKRFAQFASRGGYFSSDFIIQMFFVLICWYFLYRKNSYMQYNPNGISTMRKVGVHSGFKLKIQNGIFQPENINLILLFNMSVIAALFYLLTIAIGESYRMAQYFSLFTIILVPNTLVLVKNKTIRLIITAVIVTVGIHHFFGGLFVDGSVYDPYVFFWEHTQSLY